jgi:hypothetical protein
MGKRSNPKAIQNRTAITITITYSKGEGCTVKKKLVPFKFSTPLLAPHRTGGRKKNLGELPA